jgi:hypothetical protein
MACIIDSWVPTASITECAPQPVGEFLDSGYPLVAALDEAGAATARFSAHWRYGISLRSSVLRDLATYVDIEQRTSRKAPVYYPGAERRWTPCLQSDGLTSGSVLMLAECPLS